MFWTNIKRVLKAGFVNFWRNGFVSLSSVFVMIIALLVIGSVIFTSALLTSSLKQIRDKVDINVYFATNASEADALSVKKVIEALPEVASVTYQSRADVLAEFKTRHQNEESTLQALDEIQDNPFGSVLNVRAKDPAQYSVIADFIEKKAVSSENNLPNIYKVSYRDRQAVIDKLTRLLNAGERLGFSLTIVLILISVMITFNTIRLAIFSSREEISVMRLVGASSKYVRGPFVIVGVMYGILAAIIAMGIFYPATYYLGRSTENFFGGINIFSYYVQNFAQIFFILLGTGIVVGAVSSYLAVRRYLKV